MKLAANVDRKYYWKAVLKGAPQWMHSVMFGFSVYAVINFTIFIAKAPHGGSGPELPAIFWRGFSGHWMAFYSAAFAALYSAAHAKRNGWRCLNGAFCCGGRRLV